MKQIYCDMDEVLSDFTGKACELHGLTRDDLESVRVKGKWYIWEFIQAYHKRQGTTTFYDSLWEPINTSTVFHDFWYNLAKLPWADDLMALIREFCPVPKIISSPGKSTLLGLCVQQKTDWMYDRFSVLPQNVWIHKDKKMLSQPGRILIDDNEDNVRTWTEAGGDAILFPSYGNSNHENVGNEIPFIKSSLETLYSC